MTNIRINEDTHQQLFSLKTEYGCKSIDAVIQHLLQINVKYNESILVRLVKE